MEATAGLRKPSALRLPSSLASPNVTANASGVVTAAGFTKLAAPIAVPKLPVSGLTQPRPLDAAAPRPASLITPATRLPMRSATATPPLASALPSFKPAAPRCAAASPATPAGQPATPATPTAALFHTPLAASIDATSTPFSAQAHALPSCFTDEDSQLPSAAQSPFTSDDSCHGSLLSQMDECESHATLSVVATPLHSRGPSVASPKADDAEDDEEADEDAGFGRFTIPDSHLEMADCPPASAATAGSHTPIQLPAAKPFVASVFPYEVEFSSELLARRTNQLADATTRHRALQAQVDQAAAKIFAIVQLCEQHQQRGDATSELRQLASRLSNKILAAEEA